MSNRMMTLLAGTLLLASACTTQQVSDTTLSGLEPANFRTVAAGNELCRSWCRTKRERCATWCWDSTPFRTI